MIMSVSLRMGFSCGYERVLDLDWKGNSCTNGGVYLLTKNEFAEIHDEQYTPC